MIYFVCMKLSNCLFEAIKAKLKSPKTVKISCVYGVTKEKKKRLHFMWTDGNFDFEFVPLHKVYLPILFSGTIRVHKVGTISKYKQLCKCHKISVKGESCEKSYKTRSS